MKGRESPAHLSRCHKVVVHILKMVWRKFPRERIKPTVLKSKIATGIFKRVHRQMKPEWGLGSRNSHRHNRSVKIGRWDKKEKERQEYRHYPQTCDVQGNKTVVESKKVTS